MMHGHDHYLSQNDPANGPEPAFVEELCLCGSTWFAIEHDGVTAWGADDDGPINCATCQDTQAQAVRRFNRSL